MEEDQGSKIKRFAVWAVFIIALGLVGAVYIPSETYSTFIELLKDVIAHLII